MAGPTRRDFLAGSVATAASLAGRPTAAQATAPNILYVFPDQWRRQALGFMGQDPVLTPHLDRFAAESLVLTHAVSTYPVCSPHRGMLLSGRYANRSGVMTNCNSGPGHQDNYLRPETYCVTDALHDAGYHVGYLGKWHLDHPAPPYVEQPRGGDGFVWDTFTPPSHRHQIDFWHAYGCYDNHLAPHYWTSASRDASERLEIDDWSPRHETDTAIAYLENKGGQYRDAGKPFALFISMNPPHPPYNLVPDEYLAPYGDAGPEELLTRANVDLNSPDKITGQAKRSVKQYFAAMHGIDHQFSRLLACLEAIGQADNTIVVFTSDHGDMMGSHQLWGKSIYYEESFGIPFMVRWPAAIRPRRDDLLLGTPDIFPTLLGLAGHPERVPAEVQGQDLSATIRTGQGPRPDFAWYWSGMPTRAAYGRRGLTDRRHTFVLQQNDPANPMKSVLHDNQEDPYQLRNLAGERSKQVAELTAQVNGWVNRVGDAWGAVAHEG